MIEKGPLKKTRTLNVHGKTELLRSSDFRCCVSHGSTLSSVPMIRDLNDVVRTEDSLNYLPMYWA